ncbi:DNA polymerase I [Bhargavaea cecembensis DSE10]|uniref:DNA polymerase I n=1 Tax=Bhargavaea cecembensis DSE10 TaxID=1235279 RepID=M7P6A9_9BACL|nr:DNA polymerase I [Bhargavaea cecembensis]EMR06069.1 DNA polymerase I [Bhargavaea cecembensis DSE10]
MTKQKVLLLDGNSLAYRAFFALPLLTNDQGVHTNAVYGFAMMLEKILKDEQPTHMLVAWDAGKTTFRHSTYKEYKGGRQKTPPELSEQFPYLRKMLDAYNIRQYELESFEADDIIGTLSREAAAGGVETVVITGDKDLTQLADEAVTVQITRKGMTDIEAYTPDHVKEKYGLTPEQIIDMKGLMGDASDNIPGVPGVGEKTAIKLLKQFGSVEGVYNGIDEVSGKKLKEKLVENEELARMSKALATINTESPIEIGLSDITYPGPDMEQVIPVFRELNFRTLIEKADGAQPATETEEAEEIRFTVAEKAPESLLKSGTAFHVELSDEFYHTADILGVALSDGKETVYIPSDHLKADPQLAKWLADDSSEKLTVDAKASLAALARLELEADGIVFDLLLAAYIANPSVSLTDASSAAREFGFSGVSEDQAIYGKGAKRAVPDLETVAEHASRKALAVHRLRETVEGRLKENNQFELYRELEIPLATILGRMEATGVKTERGILEEIGEDLAGKLEAIEEQIYALAGQTFNINSTKQLGVILFEEMGLPVIKKTKTGYSTAADVLEKLSGRHEIIDLILEYRQLGKLQSTYIEGLLKEIHADGKIHTYYQQALTQTGRLSSTNPNLQNIPVRIEEGRKIRKAFVPSEPGWVMFAADYSQIELRVLAHMSGDEKLIDAFREGEDIHTRTAGDVFHVEAQDVTPDMRRAAKAVNFGIVYGISDYGLSQNLNITRKEAAEFIDRYLASFPGVKQYMEDSVAEAKEKGFVTTLMNRRRYLPDINSRNFNLRSFAERTAMNTPIQGTAADIIKKAMVEMDKRLEREGLQARMLLQVHDELIFECPEEELGKLAEVVPDVMEAALELDVPLMVESAYGPSWYDTK